MLSARISPARVRPWAVALVTSAALASGCGDGASADRSEDPFSTVSETSPSSSPTTETAPGGRTTQAPGSTAAPRTTAGGSGGRTTQAPGSTAAPRTTAGGSGGRTTQAPG